MLAALTLIGCTDWVVGGRFRRGVKFQRREQHCGSITAAHVGQCFNHFDNISSKV